MENMNFTSETKTPDTLETVELPKAEEVLTEDTTLELTVEAPEPIKRKPIQKKARQKTRPIEELVEAATKGMSDKEKENLIAYLKEELILSENKKLALDENCKAAYEKLRAIEKEFEAMENFYKDRLKYVNDQTAAFSQAVKLSITGGLN